MPHLSDAFIVAKVGHSSILLDPDFRAARIDTGYLERLLVSSVSGEADSVPEEILALAAALFSLEAKGAISQKAVQASESRWASTGRREGLRA